MAYIVEKMEDQFIDAISKPEMWTDRNPIYSSMFDAIHEMRSPHREAGTNIKSPEWKHVAHITAPLEGAIRLTKNNGFIKDKKAFYAWLDRNPQYCVYDRRKWGGAI
jgi:hypothetical protein